MQALNQDKTGAVGPHEDRCLLPFCQHALGKGLNLLTIKGLTPLDRHVDIWIATICVFIISAAPVS
jgi:hypothetical protein